MAPQMKVQLAAGLLFFSNEKKKKILNQTAARLYLEAGAVEITPYSLFSALIRMYHFARVSESALIVSHILL